MFTRRLLRRDHGDPNSPHSQVIGAILLISIGVVFLAQQVGILEQSGNWWVIFLLIPGLGLLWGALDGYHKEHTVSQARAVEVILGTILILLTVIFVFDPNWSFTDSNFRSGIWDRVWRFAVLGLGLLTFAVGVVRRWTGIAVFGSLIAVAGIVFIFDINWDYVWPLVLIIPGLGLLHNGLRHPAAP